MNRGVELYGYIQKGDALMVLHILQSLSCPNLDIIPKRKRTSFLMLAAKLAHKRHIFEPLIYLLKHGARRDFYESLEYIVVHIRRWNLTSIIKAYAKIGVRPDYTYPSGRTCRQMLQPWLFVFKGIADKRAWPIVKEQLVRQTHLSRDVWNIIFGRVALIQQQRDNRMPIKVGLLIRQGENLSGNVLKRARIANRIIQDTERQALMLLGVSTDLVPVCTDDARTQASLWRILQEIGKSVKDK